ncbi:DUF305 domain-containing protein [Qaidamihabitans albus]|uniref:DUF305 domain-containing protein n=1 Tax=Qaidamihabitans albus TaxID=2795733 RepID=UPI0018F14802|nr:DUF305 domain-containing protein [Qaidamihabitans albus]
MLKKTMGFVLSAVAAGALAAGCAGGGTEGTGSTGNEADVTFARDMIPHHQQAVEMAGLVRERTSDRRVAELAERVQRAQAPEIERMTAWLAEWDAPAAEAHGAGHGDMPGMMADTDLEELTGAKGPAFDRMWLRMMIEHHRGAIDMSRTELAEGAHPGAKELARAIVDAQQAEIDMMNHLLGEG